MKPTGEPLRFEATVDVAPLAPPGAKLADEDGVWLEKDDGTRWLAIGLDGDTWDGKRVAVTGFVLEDDPDARVARLGVTYFRVDQVTDATSDDDADSDDESGAARDPMAPTYQPAESFTAVVEIDDTVGSKRFQGVWLVVDDTNEKLLVAYRPSNWQGPDEGAHVEVTGRRYRNSPYVQQIVNAQHFAVDDIKEID